MKTRQPPSEKTIHQTLINRTSLIINASTSSRAAFLSLSNLSSLFSSSFLYQTTLESQMFETKNKETHTRLLYWKVASNLDRQFAFRWTVRLQLSERMRKYWSCGCFIPLLINCMELLTLQEQVIVLFAFKSNVYVTNVCNSVYCPLVYEIALMVLTIIQFTD